MPELVEGDLGGYRDGGRVEVICRPGADEGDAEEYAAVLVRAAYKPPAKTSTLPGIGGDVLAIAKQPGRK